MSALMPPGAHRGCGAIMQRPHMAGSWSCTYHIMHNGELLHVASATDTFCAAWYDEKRVIDFLQLNNEERTVGSWQDQALVWMEGQSLLGPGPTEEEMTAAAEKVAALLQDIESKAT